MKDEDVMCLWEVGNIFNLNPQDLKSFDGNKDLVFDLIMTVVSKSLAFSCFSYLLVSLLSPGDRPCVHVFPLECRTML